MSGTASRLIEDTEVRWLSLDDLQSRPVRTGRDWWLKLRGSRRFPARNEMRPREMAAILPHMSLVKVIGGGEDFEHRILGDVMVQAFSVRMQNRRFSDIANDAPEFIQRVGPAFRKVVELGAPVAWWLQAGYDATHLVFTDSEVVLLPLGCREDLVDHVIAFGTFERRLAPHAAQPSHLTHP